jgi:hypothetical protein
MIDQVEILTLHDKDRWRAATREIGLPSQSWSYADALSASGIDPKLAVVQAKDARMLLPFHEREWSGTIDISTIVGASGASIFPQSNGPLALWREFAVSQGWVAGYIQLSSMVDFGEAPSEEFICGNTDFLIDLEVESFIRSVSETIRRKIRAATRAGAALMDQQSILLERLKELYPAAMRRVDGSSDFRFPQETLERWGLDGEGLMVGAALGNTIEAVLMFRMAGTNAEANIAGTTENGRYLVSWLIWQGAALLRQRGIKLLNLGGGVGQGGGHYQWKERFHAIQRKRWAVHQIYDLAKYNELCALSAVSEGSSWFPAYRRVRRPRGSAPEGAS